MKPTTRQSNTTSTSTIKTLICHLTSPRADGRTSRLDFFLLVSVLTTSRFFELSASAADEMGLSRLVCQAIREGLQKEGFKLLEQNVNHLRSSSPREIAIPSYSYLGIQLRKQEKKKKLDCSDFMQFCSISIKIAGHITLIRCGAI